MIWWICGMQFGKFWICGYIKFWYNGNAILQIFYFGCSLLHCQQIVDLSMVTVWPTFQNSEMLFWRLYALYIIHNTFLDASENLLNEITSSWVIETWILLIFLSCCFGGKNDISGCRLVTVGNRVSFEGWPFTYIQEFSPYEDDFYRPILNQIRMSSEQLLCLHQVDRPFCRRLRCIKNFDNGLAGIFANIWQEYSLA